MRYVLKEPANTTLGYRELTDLLLNKQGQIVDRKFVTCFRERNRYWVQVWTLTLNYGHVVIECDARTLYDYDNNTLKIGDFIKFEHKYLPCFLKNFNFYKI